MRELMREIEPAQESERFDVELLVRRLGLLELADNRYRRAIMLLISSPYDSRQG